MNPKLDKAICELCGEPMPPGEEMFKFHGYSGPCPKPPMPKQKLPTVEEQTAKLVAAHRSVCTAGNCVLDGDVEHEQAFQVR